MKSAYLKALSLARKTLIFFVKKGLSQGPNSNQGVVTELALRSYGVLVGFSLHSHDAFTALTMHAMHFQGVCTALASC